jgi:succinate dehydrogenase / fumarate reductase membrane anchor subunit
MQANSTAPLENTEPVRRVKVRAGYENIAWRWMRYSAFLLIPLAWGHVIIQDLLIGVHAIDLDYVAMRWASLGWRIYDISLLGFAFAHGMNGLRQVMGEYFHAPAARLVISWGLFILWFVITAIGAIAVIGGVQAPG